MYEIVPVLLAGGSGERLWPLSRDSYPKQFSKIVGDNTLLQQTAKRFNSSTKIKFKPLITVTNSKYRFFISQQLISIGINPGAIIIEPESKNTAPAVLAAALYSYNKNRESILLITPTDHSISDIEEFHNTINIGIKEVERGKIVTFGIKPTHAETGYGYLEVENKNFKKSQKLVSFVEKPKKSVAEKMIKNGNFLWNSGMFLFKASDIIKEFEKYANDILITTRKALEYSKIDLGFVKLDKNSWSKCKKISIDFAIMEKTKNLSVIPFHAGWSDLGDWNTVWEKMQPDETGVSLSSNAYAINCKNTLLRSEHPNQIIVGSGLNDIISIAMPDAVLIAHKSQTQEIKNLVKTLKSKNVSQSELFTKDHRPWGSFEILARSNGFQVKKIIVDPGEALSLQSHNHRSEHWVVVKGIAKVTINDKVKSIYEGESVFVPKLAIHKIENPFNKKLIIIEVQIGSYLGEDDIIRYDDLYSRNSEI